VNEFFSWPGRGMMGLEPENKKEAGDHSASLRVPGRSHQPVMY